ncbi:MAG: DUF4012 domain-containing protein [Patescibacteria group bacterium]|nr:DUF4012 domain-containing protein [Patescibacteria group bacterium]
MIKTKRNKKLKFLFIGLGVIGALLLAVAVFAYFSLYLPYTRIRAKGEVLVATAQTMREDFKKNDIDILKEKMKTIDSQFQDFEKEARSVYWLSFVPQIADFKSAVEAGDYLIEAGKQSIDAIYPYADLIGFKQGQASFVEKSAEDRLQTAVLTLDKMLTKVDSISANVEKAQEKIATIDPQRYPERIGTTEVRSRLVQVKDGFNGAASFFVQAKPLVKQLPKMLGKDKEMTYLILFQNEHERRATGGFLTAYAVMKIKDGKIELENSTNIYDLDDTISKRPPLPDKIRKYHLNVNQFWIRDSNLSPDLVESIKLFESLYANSSSKKSYDAIVTIDTHVLVDLLRIFGDTEAGGITFSAREDKRCDCPQAIYEIFDNVGRPVGYIRENRKGILGDLMYALFFKAIGFSPSKYWGPMAEKMFQNLDEKHILLNFKDEEIQKAVEQMNYGGRIAMTEGDYLHISNVNFSGAKSNLFVSEDIVSETTFENGSIQREVRIVFRNPYEHSDCNLERGGLCLNATLRNWIRFYVPEGAKLIEMKGSKTEVLTYEELGKTVFEGFMEVKPKGRAEVILTYTLPPRITKENYALMVQKQPGVSKQTLKIDVDGKTKYNGPFDVDQTIK